MTAVPRMWRQVQIAQDLPAPGESMRGKIVVAFCHLWRENIRKRSQRRERQIVLIESHSAFQQLASGKRVLVFDARKVNRSNDGGTCGNTIHGRKDYERADGATN